MHASCARPDGGARVGPAREVRDPDARQRWTGDLQVVLRPRRGRNREHPARDANRARASGAGRRATAYLSWHRRQGDRVRNRRDTQHRHEHGSARNRPHLGQPRGRAPGLVTTLNGRGSASQPADTRFRQGSAGENRPGLTDEHRHQREGDRRICPPPSEGGAEDQGEQPARRQKSCDPGQGAVRPAGRRSQAVRPPVSSRAPAAAARSSMRRRFRSRPGEASGE